MALDLFLRLRDKTREVDRAWKSRQHTWQRQHAHPCTAHLHTIYGTLHTAQGVPIVRV